MRTAECKLPISKARLFVTLSNNARAVTLCYKVGHPDTG